MQLQACPQVQAEHPTHGTFSLLSLILYSGNAFQNRNYLFFFFSSKWDCANGDVLENHLWTRKGGRLDVWHLAHVHCWMTGNPPQPYSFIWASSEDTSGAEVNQRLQERNPTQKVKALPVLKTTHGWALCTWVEPCDVPAFPAQATWGGHSTKLRTEVCSWPLCTPMVLSWGPLHPTCGTGELERNYGAVLGTSNLSLLWQGGPDASLKNGKVHFYCIVLIQELHISIWIEAEEQEGKKHI